MAEAVAIPLDVLLAGFLGLAIGLLLGWVFFPAPAPAVATAALPSRIVVERDASGRIVSFAEVA